MALLAANAATHPGGRWCNHCGALKAPLKHCPCKKVSYCGTGCQRMDRKEHKPDCI